jgi:Na+-driven multidrug efflux pump
MTLQQPVLAAALARTTHPKEALAAYGLALSIAVLLESPIQMLLAAGAALAHDKPAFRLLQRFTAVAGATLVGLGAVLALTPLGPALFRHILSAPPALESQALLALKVLLPWPLVVAWRRLYQGALIGQGQTRAVSYGAAGRLAVIAAAAFLAVSFTGWPGAALGVSALLAGALFEALFVTGWQRLAGKSKDGTLVGSEPLTLARLGHFYRPLALTSVLTVLSWPLLNAGIGRAAMSESSLAAWPVILSVLWLFTTPLQMLQQTTIALVEDALTLRAVRRFALMLGAAATGLLGMVSFTPWLEIYLLRVLATPEDIVSLVVSAGRLLALFPVLTAAQSFCQGLLIGQGRTAVVRTATAVNLVILIGVLVIGIRQGGVPGFLLAAVAMTMGLLAEVGWLCWINGLPTRGARAGMKAHPAVRTNVIKLAWLSGILRGTPYM